MDNFGTEDDILEYPEWQAPLQRMMLELDQDKLEARVADAEAAIGKRLQAISGSMNHEEEKQALRNAARLLHDFKVSQLGRPNCRAS